MRKQTTVPRGTKNPIQYLRDDGASVMDIARSFGLKSMDQVYRLARFANVPLPKTAKRMAKRFGWKPGEVIEFWMERKAS